MNNLLLLHGALGAKSQFTELENSLCPDFSVHSINFSGHGGKPVTAEPFSIKLFAGDVIAYLDKNSIEQINIFGYSMGGYVGVWLARHFPDRIKKVFTLGTKFKWDEEIAAHEVKMLETEKMKQKTPKFYDDLVKRHAPQNTGDILNKTAEMMINLGRNNELKPEEYFLIQHEIMVGLGDRDKMVTIEETVDVYSRLPNGMLIVLPDTPHLLEGVDSGRLVLEINKFF